MNVGEYVKVDGPLGQTEGTLVAGLPEWYTESDKESFDYWLKKYNTTMRTDFFVRTDTGNEEILCNEDRIWVEDE